MTAKLTEKRLQEIKERIAGATPGPWFLGSYSGIFDKALMALDEADGDEYVYEHDPMVLSIPAHHGDTPLEPHISNGKFAAAARTDMPELLDDLLAARDLLRELRFMARTGIDRGEMIEAIDAFMGKDDEKDTEKEGDVSPDGDHG